MKKNIIELLEDYDVEPKKEGNIYRSFCPFHDDTGKPNFTVYPETDSWYCFACNIGGDGAKFISLIENISLTEAKAKFEDQAVDIADLRERLNMETEEVQTFNNEVNLEISKHCRKYLQQNPNDASRVMDFLQNLDKELQTEITLDKMKNLLETAKKMFAISE